MPCDRCCTCDDCVAARDEESRIFDAQLADEFAALEAEARESAANPIHDTMREACEAHLAAFYGVES